jgi:serine/threonine protein kinase
VESITIGQQVGPYRIESLLGTGGAGVVYLASDPRLRRRVAIKTIDRSRIDGRAGDSLLNEARIAAALNHPSICHVHEVGEVDGEPFIVMELVDGVSLASLIPRDRGVSFEVAMSYAIQIVDAVAHAHRQGIVHGDLKTRNIMIGPTGSVKMLDFGLAVRCPNLCDSSRDHTTRSDDTRQARGTVPYMAPELLCGQRPDAQSDIWALGVLLFEMASGLRPFCGVTAYEIAWAILSDQRVQLPGDLPLAFKRLVTKCLAFKPDGRYPSAAALASALDDVP